MDCIFNILPVQSASFWQFLCKYSVGVDNVFPRLKCQYDSEARVLTVQPLNIIFEWHEQVCYICLVV